MKTLYSYVIIIYLLLTTIPIFIFGGINIGREIYLEHSAETKRYERVIAQQLLESKKALLNFDLLAAELVATRASQLDYVISVKLESDQYAMTMAEIINSGIRGGDRFEYPIYEDQQQIGLLTVVKDPHAFTGHIISTTLPKASIFLLILGSIALLFSKVVVSTLKRPFTDLQQFAIQITKGDYQTPSKTDSNFVEITAIFNALETMRNQLKEIITKLTDSEERYSRTYNLTQVCLFVINIKHHKIIRSNSKFTELLALIPQNQQTEKLDEFIQLLFACAHTDSFNYSLNIGTEVRYFKVNRSQTTNDEIECSALDITELVNAKQIAESQLITDVLTQVPNRFCFNHFLARANQGEVNEATIMVIDLNGFKKINDTYGHSAGDQLLIEVAQRLSSSLDLENQKLYRLGGDEFVITIESPFNRNQTNLLAKKAQAVTCEPVHYLDHVFSISLSIGIEHFSQNTPVSIEKCLNNADIAMYRAKTQHLGYTYSEDRLSAISA